MLTAEQRRELSRVSNGFSLRDGTPSLDGELPVEHRLVLACPACGRVALSTGPRHASGHASPLLRWCASAMGPVDRPELLGAYRAGGLAAALQVARALSVARYARRR